MSVTDVSTALWLTENSLLDESKIYFIKNDDLANLLCWELHLTGFMQSLKIFI